MRVEGVGFKEAHKTRENMHVRLLLEDLVNYNAKKQKQKNIKKGIRVGQIEVARVLLAAVGRARVAQERDLLFALHHELVRKDKVCVCVCVYIHVRACTRTRTRTRARVARAHTHTQTHNRKQGEKRFQS